MNSEFHNFFLQIIIFEHYMAAEEVTFSDSPILNG